MRMRGQHSLQHPPRKRGRGRGVCVFRSGPDRKGCQVRQPSQTWQPAEDYDTRFSAVIKYKNNNERWKTDNNPKSDCQNHRRGFLHLPFFWGEAEFEKLFKFSYDLSNQSINIMKGKIMILTFTIVDSI